MPDYCPELVFTVLYVIIFLLVLIFVLLSCLGAQKRSQQSACKLQTLQQDILGMKIIIIIAGVIIYYDMFLLKGDGDSEYWEEYVKRIFFPLSKHSTMNFTHN